MKVYIDSDFHCHINNPDGYFREVEAEFFNDKCQTFIEGYCYDDSKGYAQIYPWKPYNELDDVQRAYERQLIEEYKSTMADYESALTEIEAALGCSL